VRGKVRNAPIAMHVSFVLSTPLQDFDSYYFSPFIFNNISPILFFKNNLK
jgi:hypothetical protein